MDSTAQAVLDFVEKNDVKFIRLAFCDLLGNLKNAAILPGELARAFETGVAIDAAAVAGFAGAGQPDLFLFPDAATLSVLPWRPQTGRVMRLFCHLRTVDGAPFDGDGRHILQKVVHRLTQSGCECRMGTKCEFYLFLRDEQGCPTYTPQDTAGYLDVAPLDGGENVRREICLTLEEMTLRPSMSHHEQGPGQNEIDFRCAAPVTAADDVVTFKQVVRTVAANSGLFASFGPKPLEGQPGSGMHIHIALTRDGKNLFVPDAQGCLGAQGASFLAGVLTHAPALCAFTNPVPDSYTRLDDLRAAPGRGALVRLPAAPAPERACLEVRLPDAACGPYLSFALLLAAGLDGMERQLAPKPVPLCKILSADADALQTLPASLDQAAELAGESALVRSVLPAAAAHAYLAHKQEEQRRFSAARDKDVFCSAAYFPAL